MFVYTIFLLTQQVGLSCRTFRSVYMYIIFTIRVGFVSAHPPHGIGKLPLGHTHINVRQASLAKIRKFGLPHSLVLMLDASLLIGSGFI